jgi:RNA polymerase sigma-70 factor (ECF subfamily)
MMGVMANSFATIEGACVETVPGFNALMLSEQRRIFLLCFRLLQDRDEANSATQDVFLKAYKALQKEPALEQPSHWLTRIAVNTCLDRLRSRRWQFWRKRPNPEDEVLILGAAADGGPSAEDKLFARQIEARLAAALQGLSDRQRAVFTLRHYEDRSLEEIASLLGLDVGTVKAHMSRALGKLRGELRDLYEGSRARSAGFMGDADASH